MLISFELANWMSFRDTAEFSMIASQEQQHGERLHRLEKHRMRILPTAAIYGGNASGKSNFFRAIHFAKDFIVKGTLPDSLIAVDPFGLSKQHSNVPSRFVFTILIGKTVYEYSFAVTARRVHQEKLVEIMTTREKLIFQREDDHISWGRPYSRDDRMKFAFQGTRENQLFLTNSVSQKVDRFKPIYDWFRDTLVLIAPDMRFGSIEEFFKEDSPLHGALDQLLASLDTGIVGLKAKEISFDDLPLPAALKKEIRERAKANTSLHVPDFETGERIVVSLEDGELVARRLTTIHQGRDGQEIQFEMSQESDGSLRVIDLLPAFMDLADARTDRVYVIDEIDRSLHSLLVRQLLELFLESCSASTRSQLLFTTHDLLTMDQDLLRRDEMWVMERNLYGESALISFNEYKGIRSDKDIRKSYLQGRLGGVPHFTSSVSVLEAEVGSAGEE